MKALWFGHAWADKGKPVPDGFTYTSANNTEWLDVDGINAIIKPIEAELAKEK